MLLVGTHTNTDKLIQIDYDGLLHHTLIVGQSGSGKSFFVARLLEEILLRTRARIFIIDPNGDFRRIASPSDTVWKKFSNRFSDLQKFAGDSNFDEEEVFKTGWAKRRFTFLNPGRARVAHSTKEIHSKLLVHWDSLEEELQRFLLNADPSREPKVALGIETIVGAAKDLETNAPEEGYGFDLRGLQHMTEVYALRNASLRDYESAKALTTDDWYAVRAKVFDVLSTYSIWWSKASHPTARPLGLTEFIDGGFDGNRTAETYWDALILSLDSAGAADTLLTVEVALARLWTRAKAAWRENADQTSGDEDDRVPTFIVVDEAHNFAPERSSTPLRDRVTARLMQIASEGRKYGLYLILATQRPTKLHKELVPECENSCVLRVQSDLEIKFACDVLGYEENNTSGVKSYAQGQGLFNGRWIGTGQVNAKIAPARTIVGGGGLGDKWRELPDETPIVADPLLEVAHFVEKTLRESKAAVPLASLAELLYDEFDEQLRSKNWLGRGSLKSLLQDAKIPGVTVATGSAGPGFVYLKDVHAAPDLESYFDDARMQQIPEQTRSVMRLAHDAINVPLLSSNQYRYVLQQISDEVEDTAYDLTIVSKAVRDESLRSGENIGRNAISFVLKTLTASGHRFEPDLPQDAPTLAEAFCDGVLEGLRRRGEKLDVAAITLLRAHLSGGLLKEGPPRVVKGQPLTKG